MKRVGIIGSCVTRDAWRLLHLPTTHLTTVSRTSLPSLVAPPVPVTLPATPLGTLGGGFEERCVRADIEKTALATLERAAPDVLFFDFIDERFDLLRLGDSLICNTSVLLASGLRSTPPFRDAAIVPRLSAPADALWQAGLRAVRDRILAGPLAAARIVLHRCFWAGRMLRPGGISKLSPTHELYTGIPTSVASHNCLLAYYADAFVDAFPDADVIELPEALRLGNPDHVWGASPFHFVGLYHAAFRDACAARGIALF